MDIYPPAAQRQASARTVARSVAAVIFPALPFGLEKAITGMDLGLLGYTHTAMQVR
jgi:hypothetical protein